MLLYLIFLILLRVYTSISENITVKSSYQGVRNFPKGFIFGTATSAYQVEGAWDEDDKAPHIWDYATHNGPCIARDCSNGDIAANSYHLYKRDVEMLRELGVKYYRFSLSWTRILPTSFPDKINQAGVQYYNNLINELLKYNIEPMITIYHWDLPQKLQLLGGWANPHIVDWFENYARTVFRLFGDRVKYWITINEPDYICTGYSTKNLAPRVNIEGVADYMCAKYLLLAHARAYHVYDKEFRPSQGGFIFIAFSCPWYEPVTENDITAAEEANKFLWEFYTHPIYSEFGDYPPIVKERIAAKSAEQGFPKSRLLEFTREEVEYVRGSSDIFGLIHYRTALVNRNDSARDHYGSPSLYDDLGASSPTLTLSAPWGFHKILNRIRNSYNNPPIFICENGFATYGGLNDSDRVQYMKSYLSTILDVIEEGSDIRAYTFWTLMDSYEWEEGYVKRFGLYEVDYNDPNRTRTPRISALNYKEIIKTHSLNLDFDPTEIITNLDKGH